MGITINKPLNCLGSSFLMPISKRNFFGTKWLQNGDKNTSYFPTCVSGRKKRNRISRLEKEQGGWYTTDEEIGEEIAQFYNQLFTCSKPSEFDEILNGNPGTITEQMNLQLTRHVIEKEIKIAVFSMHPNESPGPDGMSPVFFQRFWNIIKVDVVDTIQGFLHTGFLSKAINETLVTLIPKIDNPLNLAHFRPITNGDEAGHINEILECYGKASGQQVNINKSAVFFSKNTNGREKGEVLQKLGGIQQVSQRKYLGLPLVVGKSKNSVFRKEVLLKSVALALPSYAMSVFRLSKSLCKELSGMMARFWWGNDQGEKRMHWKKWTDLADRKENGELGFRDLLCFNEALLAKQVWRLLTCPNLLVSKVMKSKYFSKSNIFESKVKARASWIWQSLHSSLEMLENGVWKQVGDGTTVKIWKDRWRECSKTGRVSSPKPNGCQLTKVSNLIKGK
nr:uncharacterized protein LOC113740676 [Coffea arabica]